MRLISKTRAYLKTPLCVQQKNFFFRILNRVYAIAAPIHDMLSAPLCWRLNRTGPTACRLSMVQKFGRITTRANFALRDGYREGANRFQFAQPKRLIEVINFD
jgi:hypothetical protein